MGNQPHLNTFYCGPCTASDIARRLEELERNLRMDWVVKIEPHLRNALVELTDFDEPRCRNEETTDALNILNKLMEPIWVEMDGSGFDMT